MPQDTILVVDFGGQTAHLIARRVRELHVHAKIVLPEEMGEEKQAAKGIILSGGPHSVYEKDAPSLSKSVLEAGIPVLGLCYGHQLIGQLLGGRVVPGTVREFGTAELMIATHDPLFTGLGTRETVWMSHGDRVEQLPPGFRVIGTTSDCATAAIGDAEKNIFGLQFHPEVTHTEHGLKILENFVVNICSCRQNWTMQAYAQEKMREIREKAGKKNVFMLVSGGVDSTVALALLSKALGKNRVRGLHIDTGFLRKNESSEVMRELQKGGFARLEVIGAKKNFFSALEGITDPEEKREIIGKTFIDAQKTALAKIGLNEGDWLLGQGTIYPDTIESAGTKHASKIKTHHNRVQLVQQLVEQGKVIEPLAELYKDEVRELGKELGLPAHLLNRHPFPGPGLAIRVLCSQGKQETNRILDEKVQAVASPAGFSAVVLPIKSVGVQGDFRTYAHPCVLCGNLDWKTLGHVGTKITNEIREINRVLFGIHPRMITQARVAAGTLTHERVEKLREADSIVQEIVAREGLLEKIWQFPVVLLPLHLNNEPGETVVLRPVESREAMTAHFYRLEEKIVREMAEKILGIRGISAVLYDCTNKPPGTIEWE